MASRRARRRRAGSGVEEKLVLTYDNTALTDGVGAQLQRIYGTWAVSRLLGVPYLHSPLARVGYQGLAALEANASDANFHVEFNSLFHIDSDPVTTDEFHAMKLSNIHPGYLRMLGTLVDLGKTAGKPVLARLKVPYGIADRFPNCYEACKAISPFAPTQRDGRRLRVAVHARRGEQLVFLSDRLLPNAYFVNVARNVSRALDALGLDYEVELWTEVPTEEFTVHPNHHGISDRLAAPCLITPDMYHLDDFDVLPNLVRRVNGKTIDCLRGLATADILIMSRSSFSYVAAVLNRNGIVLFHPFWHQAPSSWIAVQPDGQFDESRLRQALTAADRQPTGAANLTHPPPIESRH